MGESPLLRFSGLRRIAVPKICQRKRIQEDRGLEEAFFTRLERQLQSELGVAEMNRLAREQQSRIKEFSLCIRRIAKRTRLPQ